MKQKIDVTFEVKTTIEVDVPDDNNLSKYVMNHKHELAKQARQQVLDGGVEQQLIWDNLLWNEQGAVDFSDLDFNF